ncbi:tail fiber protein [Paenibacillus sp. CFBP 13594]|uniref:tail fiber protein n=1 Tax=Paenibacillus sp. CFBP 13594 TaxID=2774037 RepID=UPI001785D200|nr:phage tail protein [Paenibacillus sp. CFBP 13594]MBD8838706.1 tail fiber protein [Paenibacillus sp. CFBP 13594]
MPKETDRLKLPLPLGNENVTRESINGIFEKIDAGVATQADLDALREAVSQMEIPDASLTQKGKVQLSSKTDGTFETVAATEKAVNDVLKKTMTYVEQNPVNSVSYTAKNISYYVDAVNGSDDNDGLSKSNAFKTTSKVTRSIPDIINHQVSIKLMPGTYAPIYISYKSGKGEIFISAESNNPSEVLVSSIELSKVQLAGTISIRDINVIENVHFQSTSRGSVLNVTATGVSREGIYATYFSNIEVTNCNINNKNLAIGAAFGGRIMAMNNSGQNNSTAFSTRYGGIIHRTGTIPNASSTQSSYEGGVVFS